VLGQLGIAVLAIAALSAFFWLPFLENMASGIYAVSNPWYKSNVLFFNSDALNASRLDLLSFSAGSYNYAFYLTGWLLVLSGLAAAGWRWLQTRRGRSVAWCYNDSLICCFAVMLAVALALCSTLLDWRCLPEALYLFQFPTRFLGVASLFFALIGGFGAGAIIAAIVKGLKAGPTRSTAIRAVALAAVAMALLAAFWMRQPASLDVAANPLDLKATSPLGTTGPTGLNEYLPMDYLKDGLSGELEAGGALFRVQGDAEVSGFEALDGSGRRFNVEVGADGPATIELRQAYYAGYVARDEGGEALSAAPSEQGLVQITLPAGYNGSVTSRFANSPLTMAGLALSALSALALAALCIRRRRG